MTIRRLLPLVLLVAASCGDDGGTKKTPDAPTPTPDTPMADAGPDARTCESVTTPNATLDRTSTSDADVQVWRSPISETLGATTATIQFEMYSGIDTLMGALDLTAGNQANYKTCAACIRVITFDATGMPVKYFFQDGGTLNLTEDPFTNEHLLGSMDNVSLVEVEIADDYTSTPVVGGTCISLGATVSLDADKVPSTYTCATNTYEDGTTCNCACGDHDPDCDTATNTVAGCTGAQVCGAQDTCLDVCSVNAPVMGCPANTVCGYDTATRDICYDDPAVVDAAAVGAACTAGTFCAVNATNHVAGGVCDFGRARDDNFCRTACDATADCTGQETCVPVVGTKGLCVAPGTAANTCQTAQLLVTGVAQTNTTFGATGNYAAGLNTCTGASQGGPDVAYQIVLTTGQTLKVDLTQVSPHFDPSISIAGPGTAAAVCDAATITCLMGADAGLDGADETVTYTATATGTYFIIVDTFYTTAPNTGTYTITATVN